MEGLQATYSTTLAIATDPHPRGEATIFAKIEARKALVAYIRPLVRQIQGTMTVTDQQRQSLGITVPAVPAPIPAPTTSPLVTIKSVSGVTVNVLLADRASPTKRGKPPMVAGASVFSYVGAQPPTNIADWKFEANTTRTDFELVFDASSAPGTKVFITAFWYSGRALSGPAANPVSTFLQGGGVSTLAA